MRATKVLRATINAAAIIGIYALCATAHASPIQINGNYNVSYSPSNVWQNHPTFTYSLNHLSFTESLSPDISTGPLSFFTINPSGSCGLGCVNSTQSGIITVSFNFTEAIGGATGSLTETGIYQAKYSGSYLACSGKTGSGSHQSDCIDWDVTAAVPVTLTNGDVLDVTLYDAEDWSIKPQIAFNLIPSPPKVQVPVPASLPLFASGLAGLGLLHWRRKRNRTS